MFILTTFSDLVQIPPHEFHKEKRIEIEDKVNEKYSNKVVQNVGLCICMYDLLKASDGLIGHGTGNINVNVEFRMIVFRPFKGEIITGIISKCTPQGIEVSTKFFDDIFVPRTMLFDGVEFDETESAWVWKTEESEIWFDPATVVSLRVEAEKWQDQSPQGPIVNGEVKTEQRRSVPYSIEGSMAEAGLGGIDWW